MGYKTSPNSSLGPPCGQYQFMSNTEGTCTCTAPLFECNWLPSAPYPHPAHPPSIYSIRDITGTEKARLKKQLHSSSM